MKVSEKNLSPVAAAKEQARIAIAERDELKAKLEEEAKRVQGQIKDAFERGMNEAQKFATNVKDETQDGMLMANVRKYRGWVVIGVVAFILVVGLLLVGPK